MDTAINQSLTDDDAAWVKSYAAEVTDTFNRKLQDAAERFKYSERLLSRFSAAIDGVLSKGWSLFRAVDEAHNELCVAAALLANPNPGFLGSNTNPHFLAARSRSTFAPPRRMGASC